MTLQRTLALGLLALTAAAAAVLAPLAQAQPAPRATPEKQLQAIRQALVDQALGAQTRVSTTAWINERGELMEASQFRSDMEVRGVRVMEYLDGAPAAADVLVASARAPRPAAQVCREEGHGGSWRHPLSLRVLARADSPVTLNAPLAGALAAVEDALRSQAAATGVDWHVAAAPPVRWRTRYEQAVYGMDEPRQGLTLTVRARMLGAEDWDEPGQPGEAEGGQAAQAVRHGANRAFHAVRHLVLGPHADESPAVLLLDMSLGRAGEAPLRQWTAAVGVAVLAHDRPQRLLAPQAVPVIQLQAQRWWMAVQDALACEPLAFEARHAGAQRFEVLAGADAGLRPGDRLVLVDGRRVPQRLLEAESAPHLALLEVETVAGRKAVARQVAGPALGADIHAQWVVLPFGAQLVAGLGPKGAR